MKAKSIFALILFSILTLGLASIATSAVTGITDNAFEDSFPKTAGGYLVWQGQPGIDWEIFLYNANDSSGPFQITDNTYNDINPETDGNYVTWAAAAAQYGEIFLYDITSSTTTRLTDNLQYDHHPKVVDGMVVWVSHSEGVDTMFGPGDIILYNIAEGVIYNISALVDPGNIHDDSAFVFDCNRIQWVEHTSGDTLNYVYDPVTKSWGQKTTTSGYIRNYVYDLATDSIYRYYIPEDDGDDIVPYLVEDLNAGTPPYQTTESLAVRVDPQVEGDFLVFTRKIGGNDKEIMLRDLQIKRGGQITANSIEDTQPAIRDNIVVWKGGEGSNSEIYLYEIQPLFANAGYDFEMDIANVDQMVIRGKAGGGANQYSWLLGETALTDWLPVVDGQAPLDLANKSGFVYGPQTLTLEVTDGITVSSDYVIMDLQDWPLQLVSPADSSKQLNGIYPEFTWSSSQYYSNFKIQISQTTGFLEAETVTYPSASDEWMNATSFTADDPTTQEFDYLLRESRIAYWRVVAKDCYGNRKASETRSFIITRLNFSVQTMESNSR